MDPCVSTVLKGCVTSISADSVRCDAARIAEVLVDLAGITGCQTRVGVLRDDRVSYWEAPPGSSAALSLTAGSVAAHLTALGQVLLADAGDGAVDEVIAREWPSTGPVAQRRRMELGKALMVTRLSGVAIARTRRPGVTLGVAVPVRGADDRVVAGLELDARDFGQVESVLVDLKAASRRLSGSGAGH
jgi:DNA-binding IclR family transcriptional regulator